MDRPHGVALYFGPYRLDGPDGLLWRDDRVVPLPPKATAILWCLTRRPGQLVTKAALMDAVWNGIAVTEAALTVSIRTLRKALADDPLHPRYVETMHRRGYRFVAPVKESDTVLVASGSVGVSVPAPVCLGRETELARLLQAFEQATHGHRQTVFVTGEPGIGKTTLVESFLSRVASTDAHWVAWGQCVEQYGAGEPYLPLLDALGGLARGPAAAEVVSQLGRCAPSWLSHMPAALRADPEEDRPPRQARGTTQATMLRELADLIDALAMTRPLVLVLEDLHWSDTSTVEALTMIARRRAATSLLMIGTYRPGDLGLRGHPLKAARDELRIHGHCVELALGPLEDTAVRTYVARRTAGVSPPPAVAAFIQRRSHGHPLFMVSLTDYLIERGVLMDHAREDSAALTALTSDVPDGMQAFIESQFERLSDPEQQLLEVASVAGTQFQAASIAAALDTGVDGAEAVCDGLAGRGQFIEDAGTAVWPDGTVTGQYAFRHDLYQEVVYRRAGAGRKARWHLTIGRRKATSYGEHDGEIAAELAQHFEQGRDIALAAHYHRLAAEKALRQNAYREALEHADTGLRLLHLLPSPEQLRPELSLLIVLAQSLYFLGRNEEVLERLLPHRDRVEQLADPILAGLYGFWLAHSYSYLSQYERAAAEATRVLHSAERSGNRALAGRGHYLLAHIALGTSRFREGVDEGRRAVALLDQDDEWLWLGQSHWAVAVNSCFLGEFTAAIEATAATRALGGAHGDPRLQAYADWTDGWALNILGDFDGAIAACERAQAQAKDPFSLGIALGNLGNVYLERGEPTRAIPLHEEAVALFQQIGYAFLQSDFEAGLAEALRQTGAADRAEAAAQAGLQRSREAGIEYTVATNQRVLGRLARDRGDFQGAETRLRTAFEAFSRLESRFLAAWTLLDLAEVARADGRAGEASAHLRDARETFVSLGIPRFVERLEMLVHALDPGAPRPGCDQRAQWAAPGA